jgi:hypothetical protein
MINGPLKRVETGILRPENASQAKPGPEPSRRLDGIPPGSVAPLCPQTHLLVEVKGRDEKSIYPQITQIRNAQAFKGWGRSATPVLSPIGAQ